MEVKATYALVGTAVSVFSRTVTCTE